MPETKPTVESLLNVIREIKSENQRTAFKLNVLVDELKSKICQLEKEVTNRDNIIKKHSDDIKLLNVENKQLIQRVEQYEFEKLQHKKQEYDIEKILADEERDGVIFYLIRWTGYSEKYDLWIPESNISAEAIDAYKTHREKNIEEKK